MSKSTDVFSSWISIVRHHSIRVEVSPLLLHCHHLSVAQLVPALLVEASLLSSPRSRSTGLPARSQFFRLWLDLEKPITTVSVARLIDP